MPGLFGVKFVYNNIQVQNLIVWWLNLARLNIADPGLYKYWKVLYYEIEIFIRPKNLLWEIHFWHVTNCGSPQQTLTNLTVIQGIYWKFLLSQSVTLCRARILLSRTTLMMPALSSQISSCCSDQLRVWPLSTHDKTTGLPSAATVWSQLQEVWQLSS